MSRPALLTISQKALRHNLARVRDYAPHSKIMLPVKCDAYGHGIKDVVSTLTECDAFAVACLEEAQQVRAYTQKPIIMLEGLFNVDEIAQAAQVNCEIVVHCPEQIDMLESVKSSEQFIVWLKINTGMCRLGIACTDFQYALERLKQCKAVQEIRVMTHFANADDLNDPLTTKQIQTFADTIKDLGLQTSLANSGAVIGWPDSHGDWVRPGIMVYGISPLQGHTGLDHGLLPVMTLSTKIIALQQCQAGDRIGYTGEFSCPEKMTIAICAMGYGDGYPRSLKSGTPVMVNGLKSSTVGLVSMDMLAIDCRPLSDVKIGDKVILWGDGLPLEQLASRAQTLPYEILCNVHPRIRRELV